MDNNNKTMAIVGLVLSFIIPIAGIIISAITLNKIKANGDPDNCKGLATAGLIIGIVITALAIVSSICMICTAVAAAGAAGAY